VFVYVVLTVPKHEKAESLTARRDNVRAVVTMRKKMARKQGFSEAIRAWLIGNSAACKWPEPVIVGVIGFNKDH
jgi:hypothetical protein